MCIMITRRDVTTAALSAAFTLGVVVFGGASIGSVAAAGPKAPVLSSTLFDWNSIVAKPTDVGAYRHFVRSPTATLQELEMHVTTLNPGQSSHAPHRHPNEELVILQTGALEALVDGKTLRLGPGSVIFNASNQWHSVKSVGDVPATYHVINWTSAATPQPIKEPAPAPTSVPAKKP
jgi:XRE family transcriptional regulator, regulator of sulfur utilization